MPSIDVTGLLFDGYIAGEPFTVIRRLQTVNNSGVVETTETQFSAVGQIAPTRRNSLIREEAYTSAEKTIQVITTFKLFVASQDALGREYEPDLVIWKNGAWIVKELEDYSQYGAGFVVADCEAFDWTIPAITGPTAANPSMDFSIRYNSSYIPLVSN